MAEQKIQQRYRLQAVQLLVLILLGAYYCSPTVYWRDSGEFILTAAHLDIAHSPGFPLYGMAANVVAQLPFGALAWRVNLFSAVCGALFLVMLGLIAQELLTSCWRVSQRLAGILSLLPAVILLGSPAFIRQSLTAEVYTFHALITLLILYLYIRYERSNCDRRWLFTAAFVGGLSLGNHISLALTGLLFAAAACWSLRTARLAGILFSAVFVLLGLIIYAYLPVRSVANPPLNSGSPDNFERFVSQVTNEANRELKPGEKLSLVEISSTKGEGVGGIARFKKDFGKLQGELDLIVVGGAVIGLFACASVEPLIASLLAGIAILNWLFFRGWSPDPWLPLMGVGALLFTLLAGAVISTSRHRAGTAVFTSLIVSLCVLRVLKVDSAAYARAVKDHRLPIEFAAETMTSLPQGAVVAVEPSWFLFTYAQSIERIREDLILVYQPSVLFPQYFSKIVLLNSGGVKYASADYVDDDSSQLRLKSLNSFVNSVTAERGRLYFEPTATLNGLFRGIARCDAAGNLYIERGVEGGIGEDCVAVVTARMAGLFRRLSATKGVIRDDGLNYAESILNAYAALFHSTMGAEVTVKFYNTICEETGICGVISNNNRALALIAVGNPVRAVEILMGELLSQSGYRSELKLNLRLAVSKLSAEERSALEQRFPDLGSY